MYIPTQNSK